MIGRAVPRFGSSRFGQHRFSGFLGKAEIVFAYASVLNGIKIKIYDTAGIKLAELSNEIQQGILGEMKFDLIEAGCGKFEFTLLKEYTDVEIKYNHRIDIHLFGSTSPWYSGYIIDRPKKGSTEKIYKYGGFGYFNQLETCIVDQQYNATTFPNASDRYVSKIVDHIIRTFVEPKTDIVYNAGKILGMTFVATDIKFDKTTAKKALQDLVEIAQDYRMGVNENRQFFFGPLDTQTNVDCIKFVGKHLKTIIFDEDVSKIINRVYIKAGKITSGSNYIGMVEDTTSEDAYGLREKVLTIPAALTLSDAVRWGNYQLSSLKDPIQKAKVTGIELQNTIIKAEGKARIFDEEGNKYEFPIKRVSYKISDDGIIADIELGELDLPISGEILELLRAVKNEEYLQAGNIAQLSP